MVPIELKISQQPEKSMPRRRRDHVERAQKYAFRVTWSEANQAFYATVAEIRGVLGTGDSPSQAMEAAVNAVADEIKAREGQDEFLPDPISLRRFSGQTRLRMPEALHRRLSLDAAEQGVSLNQFIVSLISGNEDLEN